MNNKTKTRILKLLDTLPEKLGYWIYHKLQLLTLKDTNSYLKTNTSSFKKIQSILEENKIDLDGENIVELGSGWFPLNPLLFKEKLSVNSIHTYDINKHYSGKRILDCTTLFSGSLCINPSKKLPDFISYYPYTLIQKVNFDYNPKLVYSRFVLEHITPKELLEIHQNLYNKTPKETKILHLISPSDHRSYGDNSLSTYDFLKYSKSEWNKIQTKFDYHNRLRLPEYLKIFEESKFKVDFLTYDKIQKNSFKYKKYKKISLHSDFDKFTEEENLASSITILLSK